MNQTPIKVRGFAREEVFWADGAEDHPEVVAVIVFELEDDQRTLRDVVALVQGPAWSPGQDLAAFSESEVLPRLNRLLHDDASDPWQPAPQSGRFQLALSRWGTLDVSALVLGLRPRQTARYTGSFECYGPEHWNGGTDDPGCLAVVDVAMVEHTPVWVTLYQSPFFGDRDLQEFIGHAVQPRLDRLAEHGPEVDGWYEVSTGHLQLTITERRLDAALGDLR